MNKRKPDDEFANINMSYSTADGREVVVFCPESRNAPATQYPLRRALAKDLGNDLEPVISKERVTTSILDSPPPIESPVDLPPILASGQEHLLSEPGPSERHFTILYGDTGYSYESIIAPYTKNAQEVVVEDPYIRQTHQIQNFVRFCEAVLKHSSVKRIKLITSYDDGANQMEINDRIGELKQSLLEMDVVLDIEMNPNMHDREIRIDNGWIIKIGRGLDFYQKPTSWFSIGANDLHLRPCLETKVDIFQEKASKPL